MSIAVRIISQNAIAEGPEPPAPDPLLAEAGDELLTEDDDELLMEVG